MLVVTSWAGKVISNLKNKEDITMELKNYEYIDVTEYLRDKYPEDFDETIPEVAFFEDTVTDLRWVKVVRDIKTQFGQGESISEVYLNGEDCELELDDYDSLEETIEAICDNEFVLYYELGILTSADEDDNDEEEEGEATLEEMKEEALRRLKLFTKMEPCVINEFKGDNILYMSENRGILYYLDDEEKKLVKNVEADGDRLVFHVLHYSSQFGEMYTMLYVYNDKSEWAECRENLKNCGISYCYTYNKDEPAFSEHGSIGVVQVNGGLMINNNIFGMAL